MTTKTNEKFEYISVAMDSETLSEEMLDALLSDDEALQKWYEYHLISDYMQHQSNSVGRDADFMNKPEFISALAQISTEHRQRAAAKPFNKAPEPEEVKAANHVFKGFAVAASLAAVAVSVWQFLPQTGQHNTVPVAAEPAQPGNPNVVPVSNTESKAASEPVIPNAAKNQLPEKQATVRTEQPVIHENPQQDIVQ